MRVIAGSARGVPLRTPPGRGTRPTADRVREALFSSLAPAVAGARVLDLFAGSGAVGIEALSRGAALAVLVERSARAAAVITRNLERTGLSGRARLRRVDAAAYCRSPVDGAFDVVFVDPPYEHELGDVHDLLADLRAHGALTPATAIVVERSRRDPGLAAPLPDWLALDRDRSYGDTVLRYLRLSGGERPMTVTAVCPGSFDPVTYGHLDVIERAASLFDQLVVACTRNVGKAGLFDLDERLALLETVTGHLDNVEIAVFDGLLVDFCRERGARLVVKGLRAVSDFEYELQMAQMNAAIGDVETFFLTSRPIYSFLSSSLIKEVAGLGGDVTGFVPATVAARLADRLSAPPEPADD